MEDSFKCTVHFFTLSQMGYDESNSAVTFYHDRTHFDPAKRNQYAEFAEEFSLQQGRQFVLHNRLATTPTKITHLKDQVKQIDQFLVDSFNRVLKIIWFSSSRILICFENAILIWLLIEPSSGDLVKVCSDSTLKDIKLNGKLLSDIEVLIGSVPMIVSVYSDSNRIDLIGFGKKDLFEAYLSLSEALPEKLSVFDPFLIKSIEFQFPLTLLVPKKLIFCSKQGIISKV